MSDDSSFFGAGWALPVAVGKHGRIPAVAGAESVRQAIWSILSTAPGERVMRPDFGCAIHNLVFAPGGAATIGLVSSQVREALLLWEPRIELHNVSVTSDPERPARLLVEIDYSLRANNSRFNLVYPFYLE